METKERILAGAMDLFFRYGIRSITMDDIAKELGISKKTIYHFYKDKDEIVLSLMQFKLKEDERDCLQIQKSAKNIVDEIFSIMKQMSDMLSKINPVIFHDLQKYHPKAWNLFKQFKRNFIPGIVEKMIRKGIRDGHVRKDINPSILAHLRMEEIEMGFNPEIFPIDKFKFIEVQRTLTEHFLYGICTLKGFKLIEKYKKK